MIDKAMEEELEEGEIPSPPRQKSPGSYKILRRYLEAFSMSDPDCDIEFMKST